MNPECRGQRAEGRVERKSSGLSLNSAFCTLHSALILLCLLLPAPAPAAGWVTVRAGNFEVFTNAGTERATRTAVIAERLRAGLAVATRLTTASTQPIRIYVFATKDDYLHHGHTLAGSAPGKDGMTLIHPHGSAILIDGTVRRFDDLLQHELAHHFTRQTFGELPLWLDEGLAEFYSVTKVGPDFVEIGRRRRRHRDLVPVRELLKADRDSRWYANPILDDRFYSSVWLLVNWMMLKHEHDIDRFRAELARTTVDEAVRSVFAMSPEQLQRTLNRYANLPALPSRIMKTGPLDTATATEPRPLTDAESRTLFTWTAPVPLVIKQMVIDRDDPAHVARYDEAVRKVSRGHLPAALEMLDALIPDLPRGQLLDDATKLRAEVAEILRKNHGGAR